MFATPLVRALLGAASFISTVSGVAIDSDLVFKRQDVWPSSIANDVHDRSWPEFANKTQRWTTYSAPTFNEIFIPQNERELSMGVSISSLAVSSGIDLLTYYFSS
jgi:hypothetical protein